MYQILNRYGWGLTKAVHASSSGKPYTSETVFIQHCLLKELNVYKSFFAEGVGSFYLASDNTLIPEAPANSWMVPQMLMLKRRGMFANKDWFEVDFSPKWMKVLMSNMLAYLDANFEDKFEGLEFHYAALVWLNRMTFVPEMGELLETRDEVKILNTIKYMCLMQIDSPEMVECFSDASEYNSIPDAYSEHILKQ